MMEALYAVLGFISGGLLTFLGTALTAKHRTQGARRDKAVSAALKEFEQLSPIEHAPSLAELIHYHYRLIEFLERRDSVQNRLKALLSGENPLEEFQVESDRIRKLHPVGTTDD